MSPNVTQCFAVDRIAYKEGLPATDWIFVGINLTLMLSICLGNGIIIATFLRIGKRLTLSSYLILQLALADFALGFSLLYDALTIALRTLVINHNLCALRQAMYLFPGTASVIGILVITSDRYLAIVRNPLTYQEMPSRRQHATYTRVIWIPSAVFGIALPMLWHNLCPENCIFFSDHDNSISQVRFLAVLRDAGISDDSSIRPHTVDCEETLADYYQLHISTSRTTTRSTRSSRPNRRKRLHQRTN